MTTNDVVSAYERYAKKHASNFAKRNSAFDEWELTSVALRAVWDVAKANPGTLPPPVLIKTAVCRRMASYAKSLRAKGRDHIFPIRNLEPKYNDHVDTFEDMIAWLPEKEKKALRLLFIEERSQKEIAEMLGMRQSRFSYWIRDTLILFQQRLRAVENDTYGNLPDCIKNLGSTGRRICKAKQE